MRGDFLELLELGLIVLLAEGEADGLPLLPLVDEAGAEGDVAEAVEAAADEVVVGLVELLGLGVPVGQLLEGLGGGGHDVVGRQVARGLLQGALLDPHQRVDFPQLVVAHVESLSNGRQLSYLLPDLLGREQEVAFGVGRVDGRGVDQREVGAREDHVLGQLSHAAIQAHDEHVRLQQPSEGSRR